jgi:hypothetical protein
MDSSLYSAGNRVKPDLSCIVNPTSSTAPRSWPRRLVNRLEVDRATFYSIAARGWQLAAGPVSMIVIALWFSEELQGYFYTFASLMALQGLIELGLHAVIINVASHEWARLVRESDGRVTGDPIALARLARLTRLCFRWYGCAAALFALGVGPAGVLFFSRDADDGVAWLAPWCALVALTSGVLWTWSLTAVLDGCNQMAAVHRVRLGQAVTGSLVVWACMILGAGLWAAVAAVCVRLLWDAWLVGVAYRRMFQTLWRQPVTDATLDWREEVWPLQWRIGARAIAGYFALNLFTPIMFHYHGSAEAGRMGMTWTALTAIEGAAFAWVLTRMAVFGMLAARRDFRELDRVFRRLLTISWIMLLCGSLVLCGGVIVLNLVPLDLARKLSDRLLPLTPTVLFCAAVWLLHIPKCQSIYLLAHKRDPLLIPGLLLTGLIALFVWLGGRDYGASGAAWGYLVVVAVLYVPLWTWIWFRCRREWHAER